MIRPKYVASCSGGKDSVATLLLAAQHKEPLDEAVFSEVMFDKDTSGEVRNTGTSSMTGSSPSAKRSWASSSLFSMRTRPTMMCSITSLPADRIMRGSRFCVAGMCAVNRDCKIPPVRKYNAALSPDTVSYVGIAQDEPKRLARLDGVTKVSLLAKYGMTEADATSSVRNTGCFPRSTITAEETAAGSVPTPVTRSCCTWSQSTRICLTG